MIRWMWNLWRLGWSVFFRPGSWMLLFDSWHEALATEEGDDGESPIWIPAVETPALDNKRTMWDER